MHQVQDREQTWLDLNLADPGTHQSRRLLRETTSAWVNENGNPMWLADGSFLWFSERTGFKQLYRVSADGKDRRPVTNGRWDVRAFYGVDEKAGVAYFGAGARDHLSTDIYRIGLDGGGMTRLSRTDGTHRATFSPGFSRYVDVWSDVRTPPQTRLHGADGSEQRLIESNDVKALREYRFANPEFVQIKARDGFPLDALMLKPPDFDPVAPVSRLPVHVCGAGDGTGAQSVGRIAVRLSSTAGAAGRHCMDARQSQRRRTRRRSAVAGVRSPRRARASRISRTA